MDNLSSHKGPAVRRAIEAGLVKTCSTFHPIVPTSTRSKTFAKLKALLRKAAVRTIGALWDQIGMILNLSTPRQSEASR